MAKQKLAEIEFEYEKRLQEGYLEKARDYLTTVYIPLSIEITKLNASYLSFRKKSDVKIEKKRFEDAIKDFITKIDSFGHQGANAFYTTELDDTLQSFSEFLSRSLTAQETNIKGVNGQNGCLKT